MENKLEKKYGLLTAICMVVGIVIGSGVFFKAQTILEKTGGNMPLGILAWLIGGAIMLVCALAFATMAAKYEKINGVVDYAEATVGGKYAYYVGWFLTTIYYPTLTSVLAWLSARYTMVFLRSARPDFPLTIAAEAGGEVFGPETMALATFYLVAAYALNALSPRLAGKFQVSTTVIKMIPLALMAVVGTVYGLMSGMTMQNFTTVAAGAVAAPSAHPLFAAVVATAFAYEGWVITTSINAELKNSKKNLPRALVIGAVLVIVTYIGYYVGVAGGATNEQLIAQGATVAFTNIFGGALGTILNLFIAISCLGTLNGLMLGCTRGLYSLAARGRGPLPKVFSQVDPMTNMPNNSAIVGLLLCGFWGFYFYAANLSADPGSWFGPFCFDSSELPIVTIYAMYLPIFLRFMKRATELGPVQRWVIPSLAILGSVFMVVAAFFAHGKAVLFYLALFAVVMAAGALLDSGNGKKAERQRRA